jgi:hypothetical protein
LLSEIDLKLHSISITEWSLLPNSEFILRFSSTPSSLVKTKSKTIAKKIVSQTEKRKQDPKHTIQLNRKALSKIKRKERLWTMYLNTRDGEAYKEYCKVRNQVRTLTRKITKQFEKQIAQEV